MRPLALKVPSEDILRSGNPAAILMGQVGPCCMVSERPLSDAAVVWHPRVGVLHHLEGPAAPDEWQGLYLLDPVTARVVLERGAPAPASLLHPGSDETFGLEGSPFSYALEKIAVSYLDDEGSPEGEPQEEEHVIVRGNDTAALDTIRFFALNSIYFDEETGGLRMPRSDYLSMKDHRLHHRTRTWHKVSRAVGLLAAAETVADRALLMQGLRLLASSSGHWSLWATQLWSRFKDSDLVAAALGPGSDTAKLMELASVADSDALGHGPHNAFPGTRDSWPGVASDNN